MLAQSSSLRQQDPSPKASTSGFRGLVRRLSSDLSAGLPRRSSLTLNTDRRDSLTSPSSPASHEVDLELFKQFSIKTSSLSSEDSETEGSTRDSLSITRFPIPQLNSSSPASELPQTWVEWNAAYAAGLIDFNDPPPPPSTLGGYESEKQRTSTGLYRAPTPLNEKSRQRAVNNLELIQRDSKNWLHPDFHLVKDPNVLFTEHPLKSPLPKEMSTHPALLNLVREAKDRFSTGGSTISLMDEGSQVFLAEEGFGTNELPRESTICSHTMLKATTGQSDPLVVLNIEEDWRFGKNDFGGYSKGFYAACPIMMPAPFGDHTTGNGQYPAGVFCIIDEKPRTSFSHADREHLERMATRASVELKSWQKEQRIVKSDNLSYKREAWTRSKLVRRVSAKSSLDTVNEVNTPPLTPDLSDPDSISTQDPVVAEQEAPPRRPSLVSFASSDGSEMVTTEVKPTFSKRGALGKSGVHATKPPPLADDLQSVLDLSTQLIGESLELDFCYLAAITLPKPGAMAMASDPIRLLSAHNVPIPAPLFDLQLHLDMINSAKQALLFTNPDFSEEDGEFSTGLLVKVNSIDGIGYVLGAFSDDKRKVINREDFRFFQSFAKDIKKWTDNLNVV